MNTQHVIEHYGHLEKSEYLVILDHSLIADTLVLEAPEPFPGCLKYYGENPRYAKPLYVYFVLDDEVDLETYARAHQAVKQKSAWNFSGAFTYIKCKYGTFKSIRVRRLDSFDQIEPLQRAYRTAGIAFKKKTKMCDGTAQLTFYKLFQLEDLGNGLYLDRDEKDHGYFKVPTHLNEDAFAELLIKIKNNTGLQTYDFARAFFYSKHKIMDVVRVYNPTMSKEVVQNVSAEFLKRWQ